MNPNTLETLRRLCLVPLTALCLVPMARAQTSAAPAASMPRQHMMPAAAGSDGMKSSMMTGMDGMQKMQMSGDTDKDFAMMMKCTINKASRWREWNLRMANHRR